VKCLIYSLFLMIGTLLQKDVEDPSSNNKNQCVFTTSGRVQIYEIYKTIKSKWDVLVWNIKTFSNCWQWIIEKGKILNQF
jgi:hypothetical protein